MDRSLVTHTHSECHVLVKVSGEDTYFKVNGRRVRLAITAVLVVPRGAAFCDPQPGAVLHRNPGALHQAWLLLHGSRWRWWSAGFFCPVVYRAVESQSHGRHPGRRRMAADRAERAYGIHAVRLLDPELIEDFSLAAFIATGGTELS